MCILCATVWGQSNTPSLPELATPSPKASMINRFGSYPTNLYTGLIDITVPIHTISLKGINIPIEFKYHASGLKYDDLPMELGYGWTLIAGGVVSYSARATGAFPPNGIHQTPPFIKKVSDIALNGKTGGGGGSAAGDQQFLEYIINGTKDQHQSVNYYCDSEYDVYNFSFPGYNGQHYVLSDGTSFTTPVGTTWLDGPYAPIARDEHGNEYRFEVNDRDMILRNHTHYLTKIITADKADTINFVYRQISWGASSSHKVSRPIITNSFDIEETTYYSSGTVGTVTRHEGAPGIIHKEFNTPILTEINYKGGKVTFNYSTSSIRSLERIDIKNYWGALVKSVVLDKTDHKYLNAVTFRDKNSQTVYSYGFQYNGTKPEGNARLDYWGYYKDSSSGQTLYAPNFLIPNGGSGYTIPGMDRSPSESQMQRGTLEKIIYPTKGYSVFIYEGHRSGGQLYGGLRIKEIKNYDENGKLQETKWYKYGRNESGNGRAIRTIEPNDFLSPSRIITSVYGSGVGSTPIPYDKIYIKSYGAFSKCSYFSMGSSVVYPCVTEYTGSSKGTFGKTTYEYTDFADETTYWTKRGHVTEFPLKNNAWKCGKLLWKEIKNNSGQTVYCLDNTYEEKNRQDFINLRVLPYYKISGVGSGGIEKAFSLYPLFERAIGGSLHDYYNYYITRGEYVVKESRETIDGVRKTTQYSYNELGQVIEQTLIDEDNNQFITKYKYPHELKKDAPSNSLYQTMNEKNILAPVLEKEEYKGSTLLAKTVNQHRIWPGGLIALEYVKQLAGSTLEDRIRYHSYDSYGNPKEISKDNLERVVYLWSHKGRCPIAEIRNATYSQIVSALGQTFLDNLTKAAEATTANMNQIEGLRNNTTLSAAQITTFYYNSYSADVSKIIEPNGTKTNFEYDTFGRLSRVTDHNGKTLEVNQYSYKQ